MRGSQQELEHTQSRHTGPRKWLTAVTWLIAAGLHAKANQTTMRVAEDLAARMDYSTGHVRYCLDETAARLGIDRSTVKRHAKYLRELGSLAWAQHGSRTNLHRLRGLKGYAGTATVYAAVIPAAYDHAMGHRIVGTGYAARIVIDQRGQAKPVDNSPVDNPDSEGLAPPSLTLVKEESQVQMVGGFTTTAERSRNDSTTTPSTGKSSRQKRATILGASVTAAGMQLGDKLAAAIRRRVPWAHRASHDQLRWVCADMGEQQWTEDQAVRFVVEAGHQHGAGFAWNPDRPHRLLAAELKAAREHEEHDRQMQEHLAQAVAWKDSTAGRAAADLASLAKLFAPAAEPEPKQAYTAEERRAARMDWNIWPEVAAHYAEDKDDALDLYGKRLCVYAEGMAARMQEREERWS